jgi:hypothetical protein
VLVELGLVEHRYQAVLEVVNPVLTASASEHPSHECDHHQPECVSHRLIRIEHFHHHQPRGETSGASARGSLVFVRDRVSSHDGRPRVARAWPRDTARVARDEELRVRSQPLIGAPDIA